MIIDQCRKLALRAPARVVFPDALDVRVLKAAHYLQQQGRRIRSSSPALRAAVRPGERLPLTAGHRSAQQPDARDVCRRLAGARGDKAPDAVDKLADPLMFAAAMVSAGQAEVYRRKSLVNRQRAARWSRLIGLQPGCKTLSLSDAAAVYRTAAGVCRLQRGAAADRGAAGGYRDCQR
ncbi:phosphate acyltransferase [Klebsiella pneumoniae]|uniref:phosphate acyltransferase n=1 Tax=Klebsiella pneumoniae TaxID=573 RepID=UPI000F250965|nr:Ethanolamine utilization protein EutD [Klebsiella pneumoniae]